MKISLPFIIATFALVSGCSTMHDLNPFSSAISDFDEDGDGVISQREAQTLPGLIRNFDRIDTNDSGGISPDEYQAATTRLANLAFEEVDINGDGVISVREAAAMPVSLKEAFGTIDTDGDGNVSMAEYRAGRTNLLQNADFTALDTDDDGVIDAQEAADMPVLSKAFDRIDTNADGLLSQDEYATTQR